MLKEQPNTSQLSQRRDGSRRTNQRKPMYIAKKETMLISLAARGETQKGSIPSRPWSPDAIVARPREAANHAIPFILRYLTESTSNAVV
jgi:hypothetical protein